MSKAGSPTALKLDVSKSKEVYLEGNYFRDQNLLQIFK